MRTPSEQAAYRDGMRHGALTMRIKTEGEFAGDARRAYEHVEGILRMLDGEVYVEEREDVIAFLASIMQALDPEGTNRPLARFILGQMLEEVGQANPGALVERMLPLGEVPDAAV